MKKFLLSVAVLATTVLTANAQSVFNVTSLVMDGTLTVGAANSTVGTFTVGDISYIALSGRSSQVSANVSYFSDNPSSITVDNYETEAIRYEYRLQTGGTTGTTDGQLSRYFSINATSAGTIKVAVRTGSNSDETRVMKVSQEDDVLYESPILEANNPDSNLLPTGENGTRIYPYITIPVTNAGVVLIESITSGLNFYLVEWIPDNDSSLKDAISSDLLKKANNELVNPTNLEVTIVSAGGATVLKSSKSSINLSGLASGQYVAVTAQGTLKFVK
jgi:hypothetical protein